MNLLLRSLTFSGLRGRLRGMFNLNDPRWGRGDDKNEGQRSEGNKGPNQGPPTSTSSGATSTASSVASSEDAAAAAAMAATAAATSSRT